MMGWWDPQPKTAFHDRQWKRADLSPWDAKWAALSVEARRDYMEVPKGIKLQGKGPRPAFLAIAAPVREELHRGGFIFLKVGSKGEELTVAPEAKPFIDRMRTLLRCELLAAETDLRRYVNHAYDSYAFAAEVTKIVTATTGVGRYELPGDPLDLFVTGPRWAGWVCDHLKTPLLRPLAEAVKAVGGAFPLEKLAEMVPGADPVALRAAYDALVNYAVLVEDIDPKSKGIMAGYLGSVRAGWKQAEKREIVLEPVTPAQVEGDIGSLVIDLRALLLEMAGGPVQLKQDGYLFAKEEERMFGCLPELLGQKGGGSQLAASRINAAFSYAGRLGLTARATRQGKRFLELSDKAGDWLRQGTEAQHSGLFSLFRAKPQDRWSYYSPGDTMLLGTSLQAIPRSAGAKADNPRFKYDPEPVRRALKSAFETLPVGEFYLADAVIAHLSAKDRNPFLLGLPLDRVALHLHERLILPLEEMVEKTTREALRTLLHERLVPLGCFRVGESSDGKMLIARMPRLSRYFDGSAPPAEEPLPAGAECRVIVQPDFSVIVIGLNPGPASEIAAFAARDKSAKTPGAVIFRLTREDVFRGLMGGLSGDKMVEALKRLSSTPVPANIEAQVKAWASQGRVVSNAVMLVIRCPDGETADRVMGSLGKSAERLGPQTVGIPEGKLSSAQRQKLASAGVMVT